MTPSNGLSLEEARAERRGRAIVDRATGRRYRNPFKAHQHDLGRYSVGVELYLELLKWCTMLIFLMCLLKVPQMGFSMLGTMLPSLGGVYKTMMGNIGQQPSDFPIATSMGVANELMNREIILGTNFEISKATETFSILDLITAIMTVLFVFVFIRLKAPRLIEINDKANHTMSDHTLLAAQLPDLGVSAEEYKKLLREHFSSLAPSMSPNHPKHRLQFGKGKHDHIKSSRASLDFNAIGPLTPEKLIPEIQLIRDNDGLLREYIHFQKTREKHEKRTKHLQEKGQPLAGKDLKVAQKIAEMENELQHPEHIVNARVIGALISFEHPADKDAVVEDYAGSRSAFLRHSQAAHLQFQNTPIYVADAPEPEDILWENVDYPSGKRTRNLCLLGLGLAIALFVGFWILSSIERLGEHETFKAAPKATHYRMHFEVNDANHEVWSLCDFKFYSDVGCTKAMSAPTIEPDDSDFSTSVLPHFSCNDLSSWTSTNTAGTKKTYSMFFHEPTEIGCFEFKKALYTNSNVRLNSYARQFNLQACEEVDEVHLCHTARSFLLTEKDNTIPLIDYVSLSESRCTDSDLTGITDEILHKLNESVEEYGEHDADEVEEEEEEEHAEKQHGESQHYEDENSSERRMLAIKPGRFARRHRFAITSTSGEAEPAGHKALRESEDGGEVERIQNAGYFLTCACEEHEFAESHSCHGLHKEHKRALWKHWGISALVHFMNSLLKKCMRKSIFKWGYSPSKTHRYTVCLVAIFVTEFVNSSFILLILGTKVFKHGVFPRGKNGDIGGLWYEEVGVNIQTFGFIYIVYPHILQLFTILINFIKRRLKAKKADTQEQLNHAYFQKDLKLDNRMASMISLACFVLTYSAPCPFMLVCGFFGFLLAYWCDKIQYLYNSQRPDPMRPHIVFTACFLLLLGSLVHLFMAIATFGHPLVAPSLMTGDRTNRFVERLGSTKHHLTYMFEHGGAVLEKGWFKDRLYTYFFSQGSLPHFVTLIVLLSIGAILAILWMISIILLRKNKHTLYEFVMWVIVPTPKAFVDDETFTGLQAKYAEEPGAVASYYWGKNPDYKEVAKMLDGLLASRASRPDPTSMEDGTQRSESWVSVSVKQPDTARTAAAQ